MTRKDLLGHVPLQVRDGEQQVLGGDVLVLKLEASLKACSSSLLAGIRERSLRGFAGNLWQLLDLAVNVAEDGLRADADFFQHGRNDAFFVFEQRRQQMDRKQLGIAVLGGELVRALHCFLRFYCEFVPTDSHEETSNLVIVMIVVIG